MTLKQLEKIDLEVAKRLGWTHLHKGSTNYKEKNLKFLNKKSWVGIAPGNIRNQFVPHYSINLVYAWDCIDWAIDHLFRFKMLSLEGAQTEFEMSFSNQDGRLRGQGYGTTPQIAICRAFLDLNNEIKEV